MRRVAPTVVGALSGRSGRSKVVAAFATNLTSAPVFRVTVVPGIIASGSLAAAAGTALHTTAARTRTGITERAMRPPPAPVARGRPAGGPQFGAEGQGRNVVVRFDASQTGNRHPAGVAALRGSPVRP